MTIWVDGDGCPAVLRPIIAKAAARTGGIAVFVSDRPLPLPEEGQSRLEVVPVGEGSADDRLVLSVREGDLVVTRDIPLAARLVERGIRVIDDRGTIYDDQIVRERLSVRDYMQGLRDSGIPTARGGGGMKAKDVQRFAGALDKSVAALAREEKLKASRRSRQESP